MPSSPDSPESPEPADLESIENRFSRFKNDLENKLKKSKNDTNLLIREYQRALDMSCHLIGVAGQVIEQQAEIMKAGNPRTPLMENLNRNLKRFVKRLDVKFGFDSCSPERHNSTSDDVVILLQEPGRAPKRARTSIDAPDEAPPPKRVTNAPDNTKKHPEAPPPKRTMNSPVIAEYQVPPPKQAPPKISILDFCPLCYTKDHILNECPVYPRHERSKMFHLLNLCRTCGEHKGYCRGNCRFRSRLCQRCMDLGRYEQQKMLHLPGICNYRNRGSRGAGRGSGGRREIQEEKNIHMSNEPRPVIKYTPMPNPPTKSVPIPVTEPSTPVPPPVVLPKYTPMPSKVPEKDPTSSAPSPPESSGKNLNGANFQRFRHRHDSPQSRPGSPDKEYKLPVSPGDNH